MFCKHYDHADKYYMTSAWLSTYLADTDRLTDAKYAYYAVIHK